MWFAALSPAYAIEWFGPFAYKLLSNDARVLRLLRKSPFPDAPPTYLRARMYRYRYRPAPSARRVRELAGHFLPPTALQRRGSGQHTEA